MKYRKLPVEIEAVVFHHDTLVELKELMGVFRLKYDHDGSLMIDTLEGTMFAYPGDFIIKGIEGEFYPCKPGIFAKTYEPVNGHDD